MKGDVGLKKNREVDLDRGREADLARIKEEIVKEVREEVFFTFTFISVYLQALFAKISAIIFCLVLAWKNKYFVNISSCENFQTNFLTFIFLFRC